MLWPEAGRKGRSDPDKCLVRHHNGVSRRVLAKRKMGFRQESPQGGCALVACAVYPHLANCGHECRWNRDPTANPVAHWSRLGESSPFANPEACPQARRAKRCAGCRCASDSATGRKPVPPRLERPGFTASSTAGTLGVLPDRGGRACPVGAASRGGPSAQPPARRQLGATSASCADWVHAPAAYRDCAVSGRARVEPARTCVENGYLSGSVKSASAQTMCPRGPGEEEKKLPVGVSDRSSRASSHGVGSLVLVSASYPHLARCG